MTDREDWVLLRRVSSDLEGDMIAALLGDIPVYREYPGVNQMIKIAAGNPQWVELYIPSSAWAEANTILSGSEDPLSDGEEAADDTLDSLGNEPAMESLPHWGGTAVILIFILICLFFWIVQNVNNIF